MKVVFFLFILFASINIFAENFFPESVSIKIKIFQRGNDPVNSHIITKIGSVATMSRTLDNKTSTIEALAYLPKDNSLEHSIGLNLNLSSSNNGRTGERAQAEMKFETLIELGKEAEFIIADESGVEEIRFNVTVEKI